MMLRSTALLVACLMLAPPSLAQAPEAVSDADLTAEQWQQRVQDARRRSEEFVSSARSRRSSDPPATEREDAEAADQRAMNDPSLRRGDIIATSKGFLVFNGNDGEARRPDDFSPAPNLRHAPQSHP